MKTTATQRALALCLATLPLLAHGACAPGEITDAPSGVSLPSPPQSDESLGETTNAASVTGGCNYPAHLSYGGAGWSSSAVTLVPVFWGSKVNPKITSTMQAFYSVLELSVTPYFSWLRTEYGAPSVSSGLSATIAPLSYNPSAIRQSLTDDVIQQELIRQGYGGPNMLYVIHLPSNVTDFRQGVSQCLVVTNGFCAYHSSFSGPHGMVYYVVMPDFSTGPCSTNCGDSPSTWYQGMTSAESHEIAEALTDPTGQGWNDFSEVLPNCASEIGDICNDMQTTILDGTGNSYTVQKLWSNQANDCVTGNKSPTITSISPNNGRNSGNFVITIRGDRFDTTGKTQFAFGYGGTPIAATCSSSQSCTITVPPSISQTGGIAPVFAIVGGLSSSFEGPQDNFTYNPGPACGASFSCAGIGYGYPDVVITCPTSVKFTFVPTGATLGTGTSVTHATNDVGGAIDACDSTGSCSRFSTVGSSSYCGAIPPPPPNLCAQCVKTGGVCHTETGGTKVCIHQ